MWCHSLYRDDSRVTSYCRMVQGESSKYDLPRSILLKECRLIFRLEKFSKVLFKQSSYEGKLSDLIEAIRTHSQRFDTCAKLCSYETIRHTNDTVRFHHEKSSSNHQEVVGQLDRLKTDQFKQNNLLGNIVVTEAGNIQQMMGVLAHRVNEMSESKIKDLIETTMKQTLENFLSSSDRMDYRTQDGQSPALESRPPSY